MPGPGLPSARRAGPTISRLASAAWAAAYNVPAEASAPLRSGSLLAITTPWLSSHSMRLAPGQALRKVRSCACA